MSDKGAPSTAHDGTRAKRLELLEPQVEDWHALQCFLMVSLSACIQQVQVIFNVKRVAMLIHQWVILISLCEGFLFNCGHALIFWININNYITYTLIYR